MFTALSNALVDVKRKEEIALEKRLKVIYGAIRMKATGP
jgi:hypothetical protein